MAAEGDDQNARAVSDELALRKAEADATIRVVEAIGAQVRAFADSPGAQDVLKGLGQAIEKKAQLAVDAQKQAHDRQVQENNLAAEREKRRDYLGSALLVLAAAVAVGGVWLVGSGKLDTKSALAAASILAALLTGRLVRPK